MQYIYQILIHDQYGSDAKMLKIEEVSMLINMQNIDFLMSYKHVLQTAVTVGRCKPIEVLAMVAPKGIKIKKVLEYENRSLFNQLTKLTQTTTTDVLWQNETETFHWRITTCEGYKVKNRTLDVWWVKKNHYSLLWSVGHNEEGKKKWTYWWKANDAILAKRYEKGNYTTWNPEKMEAISWSGDWSGNRSRDPKESWVEYIWDTNPVISQKSRTICEYWPSYWRERCWTLDANVRLHSKRISWLKMLDNMSLQEEKKLNKWIKRACEENTYPRQYNRRL